MIYGTAAKLNDISVGMPRAQVVEHLGEPDITEASPEAEVLKYKWMTSVLGWLPRWYFVRLVEGKVHSYGEAK